MSMSRSVTELALLFPSTLSTVQVDQFLTWSSVYKRKTHNPAAACGVCQSVEPLLCPKLPLSWMAGN